MYCLPQNIEDEAVLSKMAQLGPVPKRAKIIKKVGYARSECEMKLFGFLAF